MSYSEGWGVNVTASIAGGDCPIYFRRYTYTGTSIVIVFGPWVRFFLTFQLQSILIFNLQLQSHRRVLYVFL